jgi:hypothetical protein
MTTMPILEPSRREVLVNLGNRYAVFGTASRLPQALHFDPEGDSEVFPYSGRETEALAARIVQSLRVYGMKTSSAHALEADIELLDEDGNHVLIDVNIRESDPKQRDFEQAEQRVTEAERLGHVLEIWYFNVERLKLFIMHRDRSLVRIEELTPLDVWQKSEAGTFHRAQVVEEVEDWLSRVAGLYQDVHAWLGDHSGLRCEQTRSVTLSEEKMPEFAVPDHDIPVLDVIDADEVIASFVPRGLWLIGSWGRIDIITRDRTHKLFALGGVGNLEWRLAIPNDPRKMVPFDKSALLALVAKP